MLMFYNLSSTFSEQREKAGQYQVSTKRTVMSPHLMKFYPGFMTQGLEVRPTGSTGLSYLLTKKLSKLIK